VRLYDRMLARQSPYPGGYNEMMYSGAEYVTTIDGAGRNREGAATGLVRMARDAYHANGIVFGCLVMRMALFSEARFVFQSLTDMHTFTNADLDLVQHPWPNADTGELLKRIEQDGSLGNSYIRKVIPEGGGEPDAELVQMRPEQVIILSELRRDDMGRTYRRPIGYAEMGYPGAEPQFFTTAEVAHFSPVPDPLARFRGMSWLTPILREVRADQTLTGYKTFHLENGAQPGLTIKYAMRLSDPVIAKLRKRLRARYGGPENAGNVLVLDEGADIVATGSTLEQLQADALTKGGERRICSAASVPLEVMGLEPGDYQHAVRRMADMWARPHWRMCCAALEHLLPTSRDAGPVRLWIDVSGIAALREGELARGQTFLVKVQGLQAAVMAGMTRKSAIAAADSGDVSQLVPDPNAPTPGMAGRVTETEKLGQQGSQQTPAGALPGTAQVQVPASGPGNNRRPQAGVPQALPGVGKPNLPNARPLPPGKGVPALPGGPRGPGGTPSSRRSEDVEPAQDEPSVDAWPLNGHVITHAAMLDRVASWPRPADEADRVDAEVLTRFLTGRDTWDGAGPLSARADGTLAADNEVAWLAALDEPRVMGLGVSALEARILTSPDPARRAAAWQERLHPRDRFGKWATSPGGGGPAGNGHKPAAITSGVRKLSLAECQALASAGTDSLTAFTRDGKIDPERAKLHQQIVAEALAGHKPQAHPVATFLGGGPASGKSTVMAGQHPDSVHIDPDEIKAKLPEYQAMLKAKDHRAAAFAHEESSAISKQIKAESEKRKLNYTLDGTGDASPPKMVAKVEAAHNAGYLTSAKYVTVDTDEAVRRAMARAQQTGRMVPENVIREVHAGVSRVLPVLLDHHALDAAELWDTSGPSPTLVGSKGLAGQWQVHDPQAWQRFLDKGQEAGNGPG
jgi:predicted ABC-type ATPase